MNPVDYLSRIGVDERDITVDQQGLELLQRLHLLSVPFENLDIHWKQPIVLDTDSLYEKIVENKRGGFCYELNGLFEQLLRSMGFRTRLVSARPYIDEKGFGPEFDHAAIIVSIGEDEYLVDVGFGYFAAGPLRLDVGAEQTDLEGIFRIINGENGAFVVEKKAQDAWQPEYMFGTHGRDLAEFTEMCDFQQYSPDSHFTKQKICSLLTADGRKTLTDKKFIVTANSEKQELTINSVKEFNELLRREYGIVSP